MKKLLVLVTFTVFALSAHAQSSVLKTNLIDLGYSDLNIQYEKVINDKSSFQINLRPLIGVSNYDGTVFETAIEYRLYITQKEVLSGFYFMSRIGGTFGEIIEIETTDPYDSAALSISAHLGYQWIWGNGVVLDMGLGPKYYVGFGDNTALEFDGLWPSVNVGLGYAF